MTDQLEGMCLEVYLVLFQVSATQALIITVAAARMLDMDMEGAASVTSAVRLLGRQVLAVTVSFPEPREEEEEEATSLGQE